MESIRPKNKVIFVFLDGVGIDACKPSNPFAASDAPCLHSLIGGPLTIENVGKGPAHVFTGIDACLGIRGIPQSATGQTALFSGINAPAVIGYHYPAFPNRALREILKFHNLFISANEAGRTATFANAYSPAYFRLVREGKRKHSVTSVSVLAAGLPMRTLIDLEYGRALCWDITNKYLVEHYGVDIKIVTPVVAARHLTALLDENDLVVFESFLPDMIGHNRSHTEAINFIGLFDCFMKEIIRTMGEYTTIVVTSDHGNFEDLDTGGHTTNPSILLAIGSDTERFANIQSIMEVKEAIMSVLTDV
jgi:2,3-bisphosphoglycerate-independent phosphoglycerate mutase